MHAEDGKRNDFDIKSTTVLDSVKVVDMYNIARQVWCQSFFNTSEVHLFINTQFHDISLRKQELENRKK